MTRYRKEREDARVVVDRGPHKWRESSFSRVKRGDEVTETRSFWCVRCGISRYEQTVTKTVCEDAA